MHLLYLFLLIPTQNSSKLTSLQSLPSMETSPQVSNESFSYGWLTGSEIDPAGLISLHQTCATDAHDFDFGLPSSHSSVLVHADQMFSNGLLLPLPSCVAPAMKSRSVSESSDSVLSRSMSVNSSSESCHSWSNQCQLRYSHNLQNRALSSDSSPLLYSVPSTPISQGTKLKLPFLRNCSRKYLCFLLPLCKKVKRLKLTSRKPVRTTPMSGNAFMFDTREESSIYEAVLHCKKSIAQGAKWMVSKDHN